MAWPTLYTYKAYGERCGGGSPALPAVWSDRPGECILYVPDCCPPATMADLSNQLWRLLPAGTSILIQIVSEVPREALPADWPGAETEESA